MTNIYDEISTNKWKTVLLFFLFFMLIMGLGYVFDLLFGLGYLGLFIAFFITIIWSLISYFSGDKVVLAISGAKPANKVEHAYLINTVEGLSIAAGVPMPKVYVMNDSAINAFATGRDPKHSSIAVTSGALEKLNREELEGVVAHEMSHIKNFDIRTMLFAAVLVGIVAVLSDFLMRSVRFSGSSRSRDKGGGIQLAFIAVGLVLAILAPLIANLIKLAISRKREYLADASGAMLTRYPRGLANALKKIEKESLSVRNATNATAHLYIASPFKKKGLFSSFRNLFSTHPPIEDRVRKLEAM